MVLNHPIHTIDDTEHAATTGARQHTNRHDGDSFGNTVELPAHGAGDVRAVPMAIITATTIVDLGVTCYYPTAEVAVVATNTSIKYIRIYTRSGVVVRIVLIERGGALVNAIQTPRRWVCLVGFDTDDRVFLDQQHICITRQQ